MSDQPQQPRRPGLFRRYWALFTFALLPLGFFLFWLSALNHLSVNHIGVAYDAFNGDVTMQEEPGWYITHPFTLVTYVSTLPKRVEIQSNANVIVARMVRFDPAGLSTYIRLQGWGYNMDSDLENILLGYAFSGGKYPFMVVLQEVGEENAEFLRPLHGVDAPGVAPPPVGTKSGS